MKKIITKAMAVVLSAGLFVSAFANSTIVKADESSNEPTGTVIYGFEVVDEFVPGSRYFFSTVAYGENDAVAELPDGSAILQFAGTDVDEALESGTFVVPEYEDNSSYSQSVIDALPGNYSGWAEWLENCGYVAVIQRGQGFDGCAFGVITTQSVMLSAIAEGENAETESAWYYTCAYGSGSGIVGPFYAYTYSVGEFTKNDLIINFVGETPNVATYIDEEDIRLSVVIDGEEIFIPFFEVTEDYVDPENDDNTITLTVGEVVVEVQVCNVSPEVDSPEVDVDFNKETAVTTDSPLPGVTFNNTKEELLNNSNIFTDAEKEQIANGVSSKVWLEVGNTDANAVAPEDRAQMELAATQAVGTITNMVYFDASLFKQVGTANAQKVPEPGIGIKISLKLPSDLVVYDPAYSREYVVLRLHNGQVETIRGEFNKETCEFTFVTDKFSTYAIAYLDTVLVYNTPVAETPVVTTPVVNAPVVDAPATDAPADATTPASPKTGDTGSMFAVVAMMLAAGVMVMRRKEEQ